MGLLWPGLMGRFGDVLGLPFAFEGLSFFSEAIFLGIYLYGWGRTPSRLHLAMLVPIAVSGVVGTFCVVAVNSWMNDPTGFQIHGGTVTDVDPWAAMFNPLAWLQFLQCGSARSCWSGWWWRLYTPPTCCVAATTRRTGSASLFRSSSGRWHR
jgi:cytochrome bd-type quinol oxidase subunit 1